jgi:hypothetical protein
MAETPDSAREKAPLQAILQSVNCPGGPRSDGIDEDVNLLDLSNNLESDIPEELAWPRKKCISQPKNDNNDKST